MSTDNREVKNISQLQLIHFNNSSEREKGNTIKHFEKRIMSHGLLAV